MSAHPPPRSGSGGTSSGSGTDEHIYSAQLASFLQDRAKSTQQQQQQGKGGVKVKSSSTTGPAPSHSEALAGPVAAASASASASTSVAKKRRRLSLGDVVEDLFASTVLTAVAAAGPASSSQPPLLEFSGRQWREWFEKTYKSGGVGGGSGTSAATAEDLASAASSSSSVGAVAGKVLATLVKHGVLKRSIPGMGMGTIFSSPPTRKRDYVLNLVSPPVRSPSAETASASAPDPVSKAEDFAVFSLHPRIAAELCADSRSETEAERRIFAAAEARELIGAPASQTRFSLSRIEVSDHAQLLSTSGGGPVPRSEQPDPALLTDPTTKPVAGSTIAVAVPAESSSTGSGAGSVGVIDASAAHQSGSKVNVSGGLVGVAEKADSLQGTERTNGDLKSPAVALVDPRSAVSATDGPSRKKGTDGKLSEYPKGSATDTKVDASAQGAISAVVDLRSSDSVPRFGAKFFDSSQQSGGANRSQPSEGNVAQLDSTLTSAQIEIQDVPKSTFEELSPAESIRRELMLALEELNRCRLYGDVSHTILASGHIERALVLLGVDQDTATFGRQSVASSAGTSDLPVSIVMEEKPEIHLPDLSNSIESTDAVQSFLRRPTTSSLSPMRAVLTIQRAYRNMVKRRVSEKWHNLATAWKANVGSEGLRHRSKAVAELIHTEKVYVRQLGFLCDDFAKELPKSTVSRHDLSLVFSNIAMLRSCHDTMLDSLIRGAEPGASLGTGFLRLAPFLKIYTRYVNGYEAALSALARMQRDESFVAAVRLVELRVRQIDPNASLDNLLIAPIQRMPRYNLLLGQILKFTTVDHVDRPSLEQALVEIKLINDHVNDYQKKMENLQRVLEIQRKMKFSYGGGGLALGSGDGSANHGHDMMIVEPHRVLVKEGWLTLAFSSERKQRYYCFLFNDILLYTSAAEPSSMSRSSIFPGELQLLPKNSSQPDTFDFRGFFVLDTISVRAGDAALFSRSIELPTYLADEADETEQENDAMMAVFLNHVALRFTCSQCGRKTIKVDKPSAMTFLRPGQFPTDWVSLVGLRGACSRSECSLSRQSLQDTRVSAHCSFVRNDDQSVIASLDCGTASRERVLETIRSVWDMLGITALAEKPLVAASSSQLDRVSMIANEVDISFLLVYNPLLPDQPSTSSLVICTCQEERDAWFAAVAEQIAKRHRSDAIAEPLVGGDHLKPVLCSGWLTKQGEWFSTWRQRFFRLRGKTMFYYVNAYEGANPDPRGFFRLDGYRLAVPEEHAQRLSGTPVRHHDRPKLLRATSSRSSMLFYNTPVVGPTLSALDSWFGTSWGDPSLSFQLIHEDPSRRRYILVADFDDQFMKWLNALSRIIPVVVLDDHGTSDSS